MYLHIKEGNYIDIAHPVQKSTRNGSKTLILNLELLKYQRKTLSKTFKNIGIGKNFLKTTPVAQEIAPRIEKLDYMK